MLRTMFRRVVFTLCFCAVVGIASGGERTVTVFTTRSNKGDKAAMQDFETVTGIKVNVVEGKADELIDRIVKNAAAPEADLFITVDGGVLNTAKRKDVFQTTSSSVLEESVPRHLRDRDNAWVGVSTRARAIIYAKERVKPEELSTYMDLADPKWKGRVLARSSGALYNQSLLCGLIYAYGSEKATEWAAGVAANLARAPKGGDRDQAKAIAAGEGDVAIMNTYYIGQMLNSKDAEELAAGRKMGIFFPDQDAAGTSVNICGVGLVKNAPNADAAMKLVEYLVSVPVQERLAAINYEFPVNPKAKKSELVASWGDFKAQRVDFSKMDEYGNCAKFIFSKTDWK